jgi:hypothetical protein
MTTQKITITATSGGYFGGNKAQFSVNGQEIGFGKYRQGINVAVFDEITGYPLFCTNFDTLTGNSNINIFTDLINSLPTGRIVALAVQTDTVPTPLTDTVKQACYSIGSTLVDQVQRAQSWALVGIKGHEPGTAHESLNWHETSSSYILEVEAVKQIGSFVVEAISQPSKMGANYSLTGGAAEIKVNGQTLTPQGGYKSGFNVIVLDRKDGQVKTSDSFNPWVSSELDKFVQTIQDLDTGEIVAIATQDYAGTEVYQSIKKACSSIGATMVSNLQYGGNWAIVGYKGAKPGRAVENLTPYCPPEYKPKGVKVKYWSGATAPLNKDLKVGQKLWVSGATNYFATYQSVGISGDYALVGDGSNAKTYVYRWHDGQWQIQQELLPKGQQGGWFGLFVDISGNLAIVGQYYASASGKASAGAAHIYELKDGQWQHQEILQPSDLKAYDRFGCSVAIDGKVAIVGAYEADAPGKDNCGAAYIFHLENGKWVQKAKLQPLDLGTNDYFGESVGISGNAAIVGAYNADAQGKSDCGAAYIFHLENGQWVQQHKLQPLDLGSSDLFGSSVAIAGNLAIVGAIYADVAGKGNAGAAYIFQFQDGMWQLHQKIQATDPNTSDEFGWGVGIGGDVAIVGARYADVNGKTNCGAAYLFQLVNGKWEQKQKLQPSDLPTKGEWGLHVSFDGRRAIIGGWGNNLSPATGFAYICDVTSEQ